MNSKILLIIGVLLLAIGLIKPNFDFSPTPTPVNNSVVINAPVDNNLKELCKPIIESLNTGDSLAKVHAKKLSNLFLDISSLIELDGEDEVIKTTEDIRQANMLSGSMLRLNIKGSYPGLLDASQKLLSSQIGDDIIPLDSALRSKAVDAFRALAWACNESAK